MIRRKKLAIAACMTACTAALKVIARVQRYLAAACLYTRMSLLCHRDSWLGFDCVLAAKCSIRKATGDVLKNDTSCSNIRCHSSDLEGSIFYRASSHETHGHQQMHRK